jgi:HEAT repeat protein
LEDPAYQVRLMAAEALGEIGPDAKAALDALKKAQNDKRGEVVDAARFAIKTISK